MKKLDGDNYEIVFAILSKERLLGKDNGVSGAAERAYGMKEIN
jgi:hypothetical protein